MAAATQTLTLSDGRTIAWCEYGDPTSTSPPIFYFHSMPSSRYEGGFWHTLASKYNLRIISPDRPGMGLSSHDPKRTILSYPADILELASHLQIPQFRVLSVSGGGPYAFACLNSIPAQQCLGGQIISSIYPLKFGTLGMSSMHRAMMFLSYWVPGFLGWLVNWQLGNAARNPDPNVLKDMIKKSLNGLPQRDREAVENSDFGLVMMDAARECFVKGGSEGITLETHLLTLDWGFELEDVDLAGRDLTIWHGKLDVNCPMGMAEKAAPLLKGAQTKFLDREGHSLVAHQTEAILKSFLPVPT